MGPEDGTIKLLNKGLSDLYFVRPFSTELGQGTLGVVPRTIGAKVKSFLRGGLPFLVRGRSWDALSLRVVSEISYCSVNKRYNEKRGSIPYVRIYKDLSKTIRLNSIIGSYFQEET